MASAAERQRKRRARLRSERDSRRPARGLEECPHCKGSLEVSVCTRAEWERWKRGRKVNPRQSSPILSSS